MPWSTSAILEEARRVAVGLQRVATEGDAVATAIDPGPEAVIVTTALSLLGAVEIPVPPGVSADWIQTLAARSRWKSVVLSGHRLTTDPELALTAPSGALGLIVCDGHDLGPSLGDLRGTSAPRPFPEPSRSAPAVALTTSGTTGRRKAAVLPNGAALGQAQRVSSAMGYTDEDVILSFFPGST